MKWTFAAFMILHGLIHFMGPAKAFGWAELPQLTQPISKAFGVVWALAALAMLGAAGHFLLAPRHWWITGLVAVALSQVVILSAWTDAGFGTLANVVVLAVALYGFATDGPYGLKSQYHRDVRVALGATSPPTDPSPGDASAMEGKDVVTASTANRLPSSLTEDDLSGLPDPVRRYIITSGAVGRPRPRHVHARWRGRIRGGPDEAWMEFEAEQHNVLDDPARFFYMDARRGGLPVAVYHDLRDGRARMRVRLLSMIPMVHQTGPEMDRAEAVTFFNDLALLAPGALADSRIEWEAVDRSSARARFTLGAHTVEAVLHFGQGGELLDFVSDDRFAADPDDGGFVPMRWSTPVEGLQTLGGLRVLTRGEGLWHPQGRPAWSYIELTLTHLSWE